MELTFGLCQICRESIYRQRLFDGMRRSFISIAGIGKECCIASCQLCAWIARQAVTRRNDKILYRALGCAHPLWGGPCSHSYEGAIGVRMGSILTFLGLCLLSSHTVQTSVGTRLCPESSGRRIGS